MGPTVEVLTKCHNAKLFRVPIQNCTISKQMPENCKGLPVKNNVKRL